MLDAPFDRNTLIEELTLFVAELLGEKRHFLQSLLALMESGDRQEPSWSDGEAYAQILDEICELFPGYGRLTVAQAVRDALRARDAEIKAIYEAIEFDPFSDLSLAEQAAEMRRSLAEARELAEDRRSECDRQYQILSRCYEAAGIDPTSIARANDSKLPDLIRQALERARSEAAAAVITQAEVPPVEFYPEGDETDEWLSRMPEPVIATPVNEPTAQSQVREEPEKAVIDPAIETRDQRAVNEPAAPAVVMTDRPPVPEPGTVNIDSIRKDLAMTWPAGWRPTPDQAEGYIRGMAAGTSYHSLLPDLGLQSQQFGILGKVLGKRGERFSGKAVWLFQSYPRPEAKEALIKIVRESLEVANV